MLASLFRLATLANQAVLGQDVDVNPSTSGAPGSAAIGRLVDWLGGYALQGALAAVLVGGGMYGWSRFGGGRMAVTGSVMALGGAVGALLVGLAPEIINGLHELAG